MYIAHVYIIKDGMGIIKTLHIINYTLLMNYYIIDERCEVPVVCPLFELIYK